MSSIIFDFEAGGASISLIGRIRHLRKKHIQFCLKIRTVQSVSNWTCRGALGSFEFRLKGVGAPN